MQDPWGGPMQFEARLDTDHKRLVKGLKRDFVGGVALLLREVAQLGASVVIGEGQGATIALGLVNPRVA